MMRFADYAEWWQERQTMNLRLSYEGSHLKTSGRLTSRDVFLRITKGDGTEALLELRPDIHLDAVKWESKPKPLVLPKDYLRCRKFNYRIPLTQTVNLLSR